MKTTKRPSRISLAMRLNLKSIGVSISGFVLLNIFIVLGIITFTILQSEAEMAKLAYTKTINNEKISDFWKDEVFGYTIEKKSNVSYYDIEGIDIFNPLHAFSPLEDFKVERKIIFGKGRWISWDKTEAILYKVKFEKEDIIFTYAIGKELNKYRDLFYLLIFFQIFLLIRGAVKGGRNARRILKPLTEMTEKTQNLSSKPYMKNDEMRKLRDLAGSIGSIDATNLNQRMPIEGSQKELQELAIAINNMLDRIDEAYRSQVRFVSDASHELRTPISVVQGYANLLDRWGKNDPETLQEAIDAIRSESENMKDLIEQLLFLARGDNETMHIYPEELDICQLADEIVNETSLIDFTHEIIINKSEPVKIIADRQLIKQALRILMDNSIKYTDEDGKILIGIIKAGNEARVSIQDNGIGIEPEKLPYIFDRFYRAEESRARKTGGSGLGLSIMKWIVDRHEGTIEVISRKGIGTRTTIILPTGIKED